MARDLNMGTQTKESDTAWKKKTWLSPQSVTLLLNVLSIITCLSFYFGVVKTELDTLKKDIRPIQEKVDLLDKERVSLDQKNGTFSKDINNHDIRISRLEDAYSKIALLGQKLESVEKYQDEMRRDLKDLPRIQSQLADIKILLEKTFAK